MKKIVLLLACALLSFGTSSAQKNKKDKDKSPSGYEFTIVKENPYTAPKDQSRSGTCWSFSALGFIESELLKAGKGEYDLAEMWIVRHAYLEKARQYVRFHGAITFAAGGGFHDIPAMIEKYGIVPEEAYPGLNYGTTNHDHSELDKVLEGYMKSLVQGKTISPVWEKAFNAILDSYFGPIPEKFMYKGKEYTPKSFAASLGLNMGDFIEIGSFTHHPFYKEFILEVPDNWMLSTVYNVPLDEMMQIIDEAINNGYTIGWGADVSEKGFSWKNGVAIVPDEEKQDLSGTERDRWEKLTPAEKAAAMYSFDGSATEKKIDQNMRQKAFDNYQTTDDHGMQIVGIAKDAKGNKFYKVKNSWGSEGKYNGFFYASEAFVRYKTIDFMVNKHALSATVKNKLSL